MFEKINYAYFEVIDLMNNGISLKGKVTVNTPLSKFNFRIPHTSQDAIRRRKACI